MKKLVRTGRIAALFLIVGLVLFIYITKMYQLQVVEGGSPVITAIDTITTTETIPAARGDIPVSYTHLDVYKRQVIYRPAR